MSYQYDNQKADKSFMDDMGPGNEGKENKPGNDFNPGQAQGSVKLDETISGVSNFASSNMVEADDRHGFFDPKEGDQNVLAFTMKGDGKNVFSSMNEEKATAQGISLNKTYVANQKLVENRPKISELVNEDAKGSQIKYLPTADSYDTKHYPLPQLFIDDTPNIADVAQLNIGDCFFLSAVIQILNSNPNVIKDMMVLSGNNVMTTFYRKNDEGKWVKETITTVFGINEITGTNGGTLDMGCLYRMDNAVAKELWTGDIERNYFVYSKRAYHQAAMWVYMLEQAYSHFAKQYGQYGDGKTKGNDRYEAISGGISSPVYAIFYGDRAEKLQTIASNDNLKDQETEVIKVFLQKKQAASDLSKDQIFLGTSFHGKVNDNSPISRNHEYSIIDINFVGKMDYADVDLNDAKSVKKFIKGLDLDKSTVTLRNPHIALEGQESTTIREGLSQVSIKHLLGGIDQVAVARIKAQD